MLRVCVTWTVAATVWAVLFAGCGADAIPSSTADQLALPTSLTRQVFRSQAQQICSQFDSNTQALAPPIGIVQVARLAEKQQVLRARELARLKRLRPPPASKVAFANYLKDMSEFDRGAARFIAHPNAASVDRTERTLSGLAASVYRQPRELGLAQCAKDPYTAGHRFGNQQVTRVNTPISVTSPANQPALRPPSSLNASQQATFLAGEVIAGQSGCEGCHEIGETGNNGPGPPLTHIGSMLRPAAISAALRNPTAPMPSFAGLATTSPKKFGELVKFLTTLQ